MALKLRGQQKGYAMAALLVALSIMGILLTVAMPTWRQMVQREKEAELIFRGQQYAHAIGLFQRRAGPGVLPPSLDVLVDQKFLRKKYKDPITGADFDLLRMAPPTAPNQGNQTSTAPGQPATTNGLVQSSADARGTQGPIMGVVSRSKDASIRMYNGRTHYNEWQFVYTVQTQQPNGPPNAPGTLPGRGGLNANPSPNPNANPFSSTDPFARGRQNAPPRGGGAGPPPPPGRGR